MPNRGSLAQYDTIEEFNLDSNITESGQLNLAHSQKKSRKKETKTNKLQCPR